jgi:hypothetical protein
MLYIRELMAMFNITQAQAQEILDGFNGGLSNMSQETFEAEAKIIWGRIQRAKYF